MVAAGPFTAADNLAYEPLEELLSVAKARRPDVLLLLGPFVDREHPHVRQGTVDAHVEDVYTEQIQRKVRLLWLTRWKSRYLKYATFTLT